jgi:hypothetical protein
LLELRLALPLLKTELAVDSKEMVVTTGDRNCEAERSSGAAEFRNAMMDVVAREIDAGSGGPKPMKLRWVGPMLNSHVALLAAFNTDGYLVPLWTAGDVLRVFKSVWKITTE